MTVGHRLAGRGHIASCEDLIVTHSSSRSGQANVCGNAIGAIMRSTSSLRAELVGIRRHTRVNVQGR